MEDHEMNDSTAEQYTGLPLDEEIDAIIGANEAGDPEQLAAAVLEVGDTDRLAWGMGRALKRLMERSTELQQQRRMVLNEIEEAAMRLSPSIQFLEEQLEAMTLERRESGAGKFLDVPGVGRWSTRKVESGWDINDPKAALDSLDEAARALCVEDKPTLNNKALREYLDDPKSEGILMPGVERRPERISVSYKLNGVS